jgi:hypothetical protein
LRPAWANSSRDHISKITRAKWTGGVAQVAEHLLSKCKVLRSNSSLKKKKKNVLVNTCQQNTLLTCMFIWIAHKNKYLFCGLWLISLYFHLFISPLFLLTQGFPTGSPTNFKILLVLKLFLDDTKYFRIGLCLWIGREVKIDYFLPRLSSLTLLCCRLRFLPRVFLQMPLPNLQLLDLDYLPHSWKHSSMTL